MKISNLRIERHDGQSFLTVDVEAKYTSANKLWFSVPSEYESWLTDDVYDAFLVAALCPAMYYDEPIEIIGNVSHKLFFNVQRYVHSLLLDFNENLHRISITAKGFSNATKKSHHVGMGFSGGVDAFATFREHFKEESDSEYKISALIFTNVGQHGNANRGYKKFRGRYEYLKPFAEDVDLPFIPLDSNLFDFYIPKWEYDFGVICRAVGALIFETSIDKYYIASDHAYWQNLYCDFKRGEADLSDVSECITYNLLGTESLDIIIDGCQRNRIEKTSYISDYKPAQHYLNVCICTVENCNKCSKCTRTLITLDLLNKLDEFKKVFDISDYKKHKFRYLCYLRTAKGNDLYRLELINYAKEIGRPFPPYIIAYGYITGIRFKHLFQKLTRKINK